MIERIIIIEQADPASFYGVNNNNMSLIRNLYPKLRMVARGADALSATGRKDEYGNKGGYFKASD